VKALKILAILAIVYVAIVVVFESLLGYFQPESGTTLSITTTDDEGQAHKRVVAKLVSNGAIYVAANHWPRAWYHQALEHPDVIVTADGTEVAYTAVTPGDAEADRVESENRHGLLFRFLTGFPPRYFLRLDPKTPASPTPDTTATP
jgi:hypothetical protein